MSELDFIALPAKSFEHRGITFTRSTLIRLRKQGKIKFTAMRYTGRTKPRLYVLRESLDTFIASQVAASESVD